MTTIKERIPGILMTVALAIVAIQIANQLPVHIISGSVLALLLGILLNPLARKFEGTFSGVHFVSKTVLRSGIVLMGLTLSFSEVYSVGRYSLIVMTFTLMTAFGGGYLIGKFFSMDWKLAGLISAGTGICGGSAIAAIAPTIKAGNQDIAYAISTTFLFDVMMVVLFPIAGTYFAMSDMGFGLWAGTAINDTSSVVAAGYTYSDAAGGFATIVKLTRTLSIIPAVLIFSFIYQRKEGKQKRKHTEILGIFPFFILLFVGMVAINSSGLLPIEVSTGIGNFSKFMMVMALGAIGLKTNYKDLSVAGMKPMILGCILSLLVVIVSFSLQIVLGQM